MPFSKKSRFRGRLIANAEKQIAHQILVLVIFEKLPFSV